MDIPLPTWLLQEREEKVAVGGFGTEKVLVVELGEEGIL